MMKSVRQFVGDRIEQDVTNWVSMDELYEAYLAYCDEMELPAAARQGLGRALKSGTEFEIAHSARIPEGGEGQRRGYVGLKLV